MNINSNLKKYLEENIFPSYQKNDLGHNIDHIRYVIERSIKFANTIPNINYDMVYTVAAYHDIGHYIDAKNHEKISSEILEEDVNLRKYFTEEEIKIMAEAVYDHRASLKDKPRSIYGEIVSSADRETRVEVQLQRMHEYRLEHYSDKTLDWMIEDTRLYIVKKFGENGYANNKIYFNDEEYQNFLKELSNLASNSEEFRKKYLDVNQISINNDFKISKKKYIKIN